jgi:hypothetical protein
MKKIVLLLALQPAITCAQELPGVHEQQLEYQAEREEANSEDDSYWQQLHHWQKHPLNLNEADEEALLALELLTPIQVNHFLQYRNLLGPLIHIYELQAIPGWDVNTIHRLLPYVTVNDNRAGKEAFHKGEHKLLARCGLVPEQSKGYKNGAYPGSPVSMLIRYSYKYKNLLQYGLTAEKDAGEQFFRGAQRAGFDFYSLHFLARRRGFVKAWALGDYTIRLGQGLIQWQGRSTTVLFIKKQAPVLQPYNSSGEFNFYRGAAITLQKNKFELTVFGSLRKLSANGDSAITSLLNSGYHRTANEMANRHKVQLFTTGASLGHHSSKGHIAINAIYHHFSRSLQPGNEPYELFAASGHPYLNMGIDYGYTIRNLHIFGEMAADRHTHTAFLHGLLASVHAKVDVALLYRSISPRYQSVFSQALTQNTSPVNEAGWYTGISMRPIPGVQVEAYADVFTFPWLKFQTSQPANGQEYLLQVTCTPNKQAELYSRFRYQAKPLKAADTGQVIRSTENRPNKNWRMQLTYHLHRACKLRTRLETVWYGHQEQQETGFLFFQDIQYKPPFQPWRFNLRLQYMETDGYNSRIYAIENMVLYNTTIPAFFNKGFRYLVNIGYRLARKKEMMVSLAFAQTVYPSKTTIGTGNDAIESRKKSEIKLQLIISQ